MIITAIYGTERRNCSSTYTMAQTAIKELKGNDEVYEFFLPKDMNHFCKACSACFNGYDERCGGYEQLKPIKEAMDKSELIIFTVPVYAFHVPGQVKAFLDHFAYRWIVHRPNPKMFTKKALLISTAAGGGKKTTIKDIKDSMDFWGLGRVYTFKQSVWSANIDGVPKKMRNKMDKKILRLCKKIKKNSGKVKPRIKVKILFYWIRFMNNTFGSESTDGRYWKANGWLGKKRPW